MNRIASSNSKHHNAKISSDIRQSVQISSLKPTYLLQATLELGYEYPRGIFNSAYFSQKVLFQIHHPLPYQFREGAHISQANSFALNLFFNSEYRSCNENAQVRKFWFRLKCFLFLRTINIVEFCPSALLNNLWSLRYLECVIMKCSEASDIAALPKRLKGLVNLSKLSLKLDFHSSSERKTVQETFAKLERMSSVANLKKLKLSLGCHDEIDAKTMTALREWLSCMKKLKEMELHFTRITLPENVVELTNILAKKTKLKSLQLRLNIKLSENGEKEFLRLIDNIGYLKSLTNLTLTLEEKNDLKSMAKMLEKHKNLKKLVLNFKLLNKKEASELKILIPSLKQMFQLEEFGLNLASDSNSSEGLEEITGNLRKEIQTLRIKISNTCDENSVLTKFMLQMKRFTKLERLDLEFNHLKLNDEVFVRLGDFLVDNKILNQLSLCLQEVKGKIEFGFRELMKALARVKQLKNFAIKIQHVKNFISSGVYNELVVSLDQTMELETIHIYINDENFDSAYPGLSECLKKKKKLRELKIFLRTYSLSKSFEKCMEDCKYVKILEVNNARVYKSGNQIIKTYPKIAHTPLK